MSRFSVKKPYTVVVAVLIIMILGIVSFTKLSTDLLPSMDFPYAIVITTYQGASPEQVEMVVTEPVESSMATVSNIKHISSTSSENYSMVVLEFNDEANMDSVTIEMRENLDMIGSYWPEGVGSPIIMKINPDMLPVMMASVSGEGLTTEEVSKLYNEEISQDIQSIDGVASVTATGLIESSIEVTLDDEKIRKINKELKAKIKEGFSDAQKELDDAQKELENGRAKLEAGKQSAAQQMGQAQSQLSSGKDEITSGEAQLTLQLSAIEEQEASLLASEQQLLEAEAQLAQLESQEKELQSQKAALEQTINTLKEQKTQIDAAKAQYEAAGGDAALEQLVSGKAALEEQIAGVQNDDNLCDTDKEVRLSVLNAALSRLDTNLSQMEMAKTAIEQLPALEAGLNEAESGLNLLNDGLTQMTFAKNTLQSQLGDISEKKAQIAAGKAAIAQGKSTIQEMQEQIQSGKKSMNDAIAQLNQQQVLAGIELSVAESKISIGEMQLDQSRQQMDSAMRTALDSSDLTDILTKDMVKGILTAQNFSMPAGYITENGTDYLVRVGDKLTTVEDVENLIVMDLSEQDLGVVYLKDVADIEKTDNSDEVYARMNGQEGVLISIEKQNGYSTADVAKKIRKYFESDTVAGYGVEMTALMDQGIYIDMVVSSVLNNLIIGGVLAIIILFIFLKDIRPTLTVAISIPVSVVFAMTLMYFSGVTMNIISLSGLALGVGMLVDNSIVVIENIYRLRNEGVSVKKAAVEGAKQVTGAIAASTLTTICIWAPIVFVEGITRQLFMDLVLTIAYSLVASLFVALTVVPMMASRLLVSRKETKQKFFTNLQNAYGRMLDWSLCHKPVMIAAVLILLVVSIFSVVVRGFEFMGDMDSPQVSASVSMDEDTTFEEATAMADEIMGRIMKIEGVEDVGAMLGSSLNMMSSFGNTATDSISFYVILSDDRKLTSEEVSNQIVEVTKDLDCEVSASGSTMDMSALGSSGVSVMIKGRDIDTMAAIAGDFAEIMRKIEGTVDVSDGLDHPSNELRISIDKAKAMSHNLTVAQVYQQIAALISSPTAATTLTLGNEDLSVYVVDGEDSSMTRTDVKKLKITCTDQSGESTEINLKDIADITENVGVTSIRRDAQQRQITVSCGIDNDHNATLLTNEFKNAIKDYPMPEGYSVEFSGENETVNEAFEQLAQLLALGIVIMYLIMVAQFQSLLSPFIVLFTIPLAFTGGFLGLLLTGNHLSVIAMVGFVMLCGIIVNNGIVFVDYVNQLRDEGYSKKEALIATGKTRLRPILMTAMTTILAMSTMALGIGDGSEMVQPMAIVTIGGMIYGTLLTLFLVPIIYDIFNRKERNLHRDEDDAALSDRI